MKKFIDMRNRYNEIIYDSYNFEEDEKIIKITYKYIIDDRVFNHRLEFEKRDFFSWENLKYKETFLFNIGIAELINYYKLACPKKIILKAGNIDDYQKLWWRKLYYMGLGEFRYINNIEVTMEELVEFENRSNKVFDKAILSSSAGNIVPIGGGKDSVVTLEKLKQCKNTPLILNPRGATIDTVETAGYSLDDCIIVKRILDPQIKQMNEEGYLNGHVPFSAILAFICMFGGLLSNTKHIILSNESSANESTIKGEDINHQYSKSFEMEKDLNEYFKRYLTKDIQYFSLLRNMSELLITKEFAEHKKYHKIFRSCNVGSVGGKNEWCLHCPKCLFVYIMLAAFMERNEVIEIFGKELIDDEGLKEYFEELCGARENKPFECVGTRDEVNTAISIILKKYKELPVLLKYYKKELSHLIKNDDDIKQILDYYNIENLIPSEFKDLI